MPAPSTLQPLLEVVWGPWALLSSSSSSTSLSTTVVYVIGSISTSRVGIHGNKPKPRIQWRHITHRKSITLVDENLNFRPPKWDPYQPQTWGQLTTGSELRMSIQLTVRHAWLDLHHDDVIEWQHFTHPPVTGGFPSQRPFFLSAPEQTIQ